jgi:hypothetical protein
MLAKSQFFILSAPPRSNILPFSQAMQQYWHDLQDWAQRNMVRERSFAVGDQTITLYVRRDVATTRASQ